MIEQVAIAMTGCVAVWLSQDANESKRKWSCVFGLAGQPFWMYSAWHANQWGILMLTFIYTLSWLRGFRTNWIKK